MSSHNRVQLTLFQTDEIIRGLGNCFSRCKNVIEEYINQEQKRTGSRVYSDLLKKHQ